MKYKIDDRVVIKPDVLLGQSDTTLFTMEMVDILEGTDRVVTITRIRSEPEQYEAHFPNEDIFHIDKDDILGYAFEYGEEIEVKDDGMTWEEGDFRGYVPGTTRPVITDNGASYQYARPIRKPEIEITCKINGKDVSLSDISEETLLKLRKEK